MSNWGNVLTIQAVDGHYKIQKNGVDVTLTGAGTSASPWIANISGETFTSVSVADIDDPSAELNARTGDAAGSLLLVYQTDATGSVDFSTIYRTDNSNLTEAIPWIVDSGDSKSYSAIAGRNQLPTAVLENFRVYSGGTLSFNSSTLFSTTLCVIQSISGGVTSTGKLLFDGIQWERSSGGGISGTLVADPTALTADRTWTLPDATGIVLLDTTPFAAASRIHGSGSGGTSSIELVAERFLSIDANGIGVADFSARNLVFGSPNGADGTPGEWSFGNGISGAAGALIVDDTANFTWTGAHDYTGATVTVPTATAGDNDTSAASTAFVEAAISRSSYRTILQASGSHTAAKAAGTYAIPMGDPLAVSGTGTLYPIALIHYVAADYPTVDGKTTKLRIRAQVECNDVAPTGNYTIGMYPVTRPATSGGAGLCIYTLGTVVSGSNGATVTTPAADSSNLLVGSDFTPPSDGLYCLGVVTTGTVAASSHVHVTAQLQYHNPT